MKRGTLTPWGEAQFTKQLDPGVYLVSTVGHGGILVNKKRASSLLSRKAIAIGRSWENFLAYEGDCDVAAVWYKHPELSDWQDKNKLKQLAEESLRRWYPEYFTML